MSVGKVLAFTILGIDKGSETYGKVGDAMDRMADRGTKAMGVLSAGAVGSAATIAAALGGIPLMFAAVGAAALSSNEVVRDSVEDLSETVRTGLAADAAPMADAFVEATTEIGDAFADLRPQLRAIFADTGPQVVALTRGVTGLAREAMPGLVTAVEHADAVFDGLERGLPAIGRGLSGFFGEISQGAPAAGAFMEDLGEISEEVLPDVGAMLVDLSGLWTEHGDQVVRVVTRLVDTVGNLGEGALPIVSDAAGVTLDVLEGILAVVGPLSDELGPLIGTWIALNIAMRGIGTVRGVVDGVAASMSTLRAEAEKAGGPAGVGRVNAGARGVMALLGGPWGVAVTGAVIALAMFGQRSQDAATAQRSLTGALRESGGEFDANARDVLAGSEQYQKIADDVERVGLTQRQFMAALAEGGPRLDDLRSRLEEIHRANTELAVSGQGAVATENEQAAAARVLLSQLDSLRGTVSGATDDHRRHGEAVDGATHRMLEGRPGAEQLAEAMKTLGSDTADTKSKVDALNLAWRELFGLEINLQEATAAWEGGLDTIRESIEDLKGSTANWGGELFNLDGSINTTTEAGRGLLANLVAQGDQYRGLAQTAFDSAIKQGKSQHDATAAAITAVNERRRQFIEEQVALGVTRTQAEKLADEYLGMPHEVTTHVGLRGAEGVKSTLDTLTKPRTVVISSVLGPMQARAGGGPVVAGEMYKVGEQGEELFVPHTDGVIIPTQPTRDIMRELSAVGVGGTPSAAARATVTAGGGNQYHFHFHGPVGSRQQLEDWVTRALADLKQQGRV